MVKLMKNMTPKQKISLNKVLSGNGPFVPYALNNELTSKIRLPTSDEVLDVQSFQTKGKYSLKNCELEYQTIKSSELAKSIAFGYKIGVKLDFQDVSHFKSFMPETSDTKVSQTINSPKVSPICILMLFKNPTGTDPEQFENPGIKDLRVDYEADPNVIFQNGLKEHQLYEEARRIFGKNELSTLTKAQFYKDKFALLLDLRSHEDPKKVGTGVSNTISRTQSGITVHMTLKTGRSNKLQANIFLVSHAQAQIQENSLAEIYV